MFFFLKIYNQTKLETGFRLICFSSTRFGLFCIRKQKRMSIHQSITNIMTQPEPFQIIKQLNATVTERKQTKKVKLKKKQKTST